MRKAPFVLLLVVLTFSLGRVTAPQFVQASTWTPYMSSDGVESIGGVKRIYLHIIFCDYIGGVLDCEWHYFGTDPEEKPPLQGWEQWPIEEHPYIQFPKDLDELSGFEAEELLYGMARLAAGRISGWELPQ